jgi:hypothetical protein
MDHQSTGRGLVQRRPQEATLAGCDARHPAASYRERRCKTPFDSVFFEAMRPVVSQEKIKSLIPVQEGWLDGKVLWEQWLGEERFHEEKKPHEALIPLWFGLSLDLWIRKVIA